MMKGYLYIKKIREYCDYCEEHLHNVAESWLEVIDKCNNENFIYDDYLYFTIQAMVEEHDLSKFSKDEFIQYQQWFFPVDGARSISYFMDAWDHHKKQNPHHWQNWTKKEMHFPNEWVCHCVCMVIDWMAMSRKFGDTPREYYEKEKINIELPDYAEKFVYHMFDLIEKD